MSILRLSQVRAVLLLLLLLLLLVVLVVLVVVLVCGTVTHEIDSGCSSRQQPAAASEDLSTSLTVVCVSVRAAFRGLCCLLLPLPPARLLPSCALTTPSSAATLTPRSR
jgi:DMSO reductase anchor subunit